MKKMKNGLDSCFEQDHASGLTTEQGNRARNAAIGQENSQGKGLNWARIAKLQPLVQASIPSTLLEKIRRSQSVFD